MRLYSMTIQRESCFSLDRLIPDLQERWSNYARGVAQVLGAEVLPLSGFDSVVHSTVPMSSGLSSSAALDPYARRERELPLEVARRCRFTWPQLLQLLDIVILGHGDDWAKAAGQRRAPGHWMQTETQSALPLAQPG